MKIGTGTLCWPRRTRTPARRRLARQAPCQRGVGQHGRQRQRRGSLGRYRLDSRAGDTSPAAALLRCRARSICSMARSVHSPSQTPTRPIPCSQSAGRPLGTHRSSASRRARLSIFSCSVRASWRSIPAALVNIAPLDGFGPGTYDLIDFPAGQASGLNNLVLNTPTIDGYAAYFNGRLGRGACRHARAASPTLALLAAGAVGLFRIRFVAKKAEAELTVTAQSRASHPFQR